MLPKVMTSFTDKDPDWEQSVRSNRNVGNLQEGSNVRIDEMVFMSTDERSES
jgi:hypothetical protein